MLSVYLCGAINGCTDSEAKDWREAAKKELSSYDIRTIDPMRRDYRGVEDDHADELAALDVVDVFDSDIVLVNYPKPSTGTDMETCIAYREAGAVVIVVTPEDARVSPWLRTHTHRIVHTFAEAFARIQRAAMRNDPCAAIFDQHKVTTEDDDPDDLLSFP